LSFLIAKLDKELSQILIIRQVFEPIAKDFSFEGSEVFGVAEADILGCLVHFSISDDFEFLINISFFITGGSWEVALLE
jgi:hypothetical protein